MVSLVRLVRSVTVSLTQRSDDGVRRVPLRGELRKAGFVTRDARQVERNKKSACVNVVVRSSPNVNGFLLRRTAVSEKTRFGGFLWAMHLSVTMKCGLLSLFPNSESTHHKGHKSGKLSSNFSAQTGNVHFVSFLSNDGFSPRVT